MADINAPSQAPVPGGKAASASPGSRRGPSIHQIYALPAPIRTFPLPTFYPDNPLSLFHVASAWLRQLFSPPPAEPALIHRGIWSPGSMSVHVTDEKSMRALWEQGFYGKGNLSRSEPNWLKREQVRRGLQDVHVSEILTVRRREDRAQAKWERARLEQQAIMATKLEEARQHHAQPCPAPPVGPPQLLALPNSDVELSDMIRSAASASSKTTEAAWGKPDLEGTTSFHFNHAERPVNHDLILVEVLDDEAHPHVAETPALPSGDGQDAQATKPGEVSSDSADGKTLKRQKSVRFSPKVESTTFQLSDPPSPNHSSAAGNANAQPEAKSLDGWAARPLPDSSHGQVAADPGIIVNREHLQLMPEEAFFLSFGLGALGVCDPASGRPLSTREMFTLFRQYSYFPPRIGPEEPDLGPDDRFLVHYAVYHHFRSLGWVPRAGIKFGVDWLLYTRGPVFDHAEFGLVVIPSYSDEWWKRAGKRQEPKTWAWLHGNVRVLSHATKSLVLVYVDVPPPPRFEEAERAGITEALKLYTVREVTVKRWSSNRNR
ncbi:hypothetical protein CDD83_2309 [Cordyceps sp. RAO-2017]|nr:hypothetical protein CDD83_2309 [Cordyceps sp. RAO-2017]